jgi:hypothetical protein
MNNLPAGVLYDSRAPWNLPDMPHGMEECGELKLLKGVIVSLVGSGDGSSGMVPRLEKDLKQMSGGVVLLGAEVRDMRADVNNIGNDIRAIRSSQTEAKSWMDGWRGVGIAVGIIGTCATVIGGIITGIVWLFTHGVKP